jgi:hypothetical protein
LPSLRRTAPRRRSNKAAPAPSAIIRDVQRAQEQDADLGPIIRLMKESTVKPNISAVSTESEYTKQLWYQWYRLELHNGVLCHQYSRPWHRDLHYQIIIPDILRDTAAYSCHANTVGSHTSVKRTMDRVQNVYYWPTWKSDTARHCRRCPECCQSHRCLRPFTVRIEKTPTPWITVPPLEVEAEMNDDKT